MMEGLNSRLNEKTNSSMQIKRIKSNKQNADEEGASGQEQIVLPEYTKNVSSKPSNAHNSKVIKENQNSSRVQQPPNRMNESQQQEAVPQFSTNPDQAAETVPLQTNTQQNQPKTLVTQYGRQLSGNLDPDLNFKKKSNQIHGLESKPIAKPKRRSQGGGSGSEFPPQPYASNHSVQPPQAASGPDEPSIGGPRNYTKNSTMKIVKNKGNLQIQTMNTNNGAPPLTQQRTINLNFFDDLQVGIESESKKEDDKYFQDPNFSMIYRNPKGSEFEQDYDEDKMYESRELGNAMDTLSKDGRMVAGGNGDQSSLKNLSPITIGFHESLNDRMAHQTYTHQKTDNLRKHTKLLSDQDRKMTERIQTKHKHSPSSDLISIPQRAQHASEYNTANQESDIDQFIPRLNLINRNPIEDQFLLNPKSKKSHKKRDDDTVSQKSSRSNQSSYQNKNIRRQDNSKGEINISKYKHKRDSSNSSYLVPVLEKNDESDIINRMQVDFNEKPQLDDKRARMMILNQLKKHKGSDDSFFMVIEKTPIEKVDDIEGKCAKLLKLVCKVRINVSSLANAIITSKTFEAISLIVIVGNSISLAIEDPTSTASPFYQEVLDNIFLVLYSIEMVLKILGCGFLFNKGAYLRDTWNILDFVIVMTGYLQILFQGGSLNLSGLRSFRVLRPLRSIQRIEGLKLIVSALLNSLPLLRDTLIVLIFFFFIFAIAGLQLFSGVLKRRCVNEETGVPHPNEEFCGYAECPPSYFCGKRIANPNYDQTNFDTIFYALIAIFTSVTLEGWTNNMQFISKSFTSLSIVFFIPLVFIGAFFLLNLTLAVIKSKFSKEHEERAKEKKQARLKKAGKQGEFDNMDKEELNKLIEGQKDTRNQVLKKWKLIMFIKMQMRLNVKFYQKRKAKELSQKKADDKANGVVTDQGYQPAFGLTDYGSMFGVDQTLADLESQPNINQNVRSGESEAALSSRQLLSNQNMSSQISLQQLDDKLKNFAPTHSQKFTTFQNFRQLNQEAIAEEDDEYKTEFSHIIGNGVGLLHLSSGNIVKNRGGSAGSKGTPISPSNQDLVSVRRSSSKNMNPLLRGMSGMSFQNVQNIRHDHGGEYYQQDRITVFTPDKKQPLNMVGMLPNQKKQTQKLTNEHKTLKKSVIIDHDFFKDFINQDIDILDQKYSEEELIEIARQFSSEDPQNQGNSSQLLDDVEEAFDEVSIDSRRRGRRGTQQSEDERNQTPYTTTTGFIKGNTFHRQRSKLTQANFLSQDLSISEDSSLNHPLETNQDEGLVHDMKMSPYSYAHSNDLPLSRQRTEIHNSEDRDPPLTKAKTLDKNEEALYKKQHPKPIKIGQRHESPFQNTSATLVSTNQNGTIYSETNPLIRGTTTYNVKNAELVDPKKGGRSKTKIKPIGAGSYKEDDDDHQQPRHGPNTIYNSDYISLDKSVLNSRYLVSDKISKTQKIYLRKDKFEFASQDDIFEQREAKLRQRQMEENRRKAIEYEKNWTIKPYQRKQFVLPIDYKPDDDQSDYLQLLEYDNTELEKLIQQKYNEPYISNLYVTGTMSICIKNKVDHTTNKVRKNQDVQLQTYFEDLPEYEQSNQSLSMSQLPSQALALQTQQSNNSPIVRKKTTQTRTFRAMDGQARYLQDIANHVYFKSMLPNPVISKSLKKTRAGQSMQCIIQEEKKKNKHDNELKENQLRRDRLLSRAASKDANLQRKLIITQMTKDAYMSINFRPILNKRKNRMTDEERQKKHIAEIFDMYKDEDEESSESDKEESSDEDENAIKDDFIDWPIDFKAEILKAKKKAAFSKKSDVNWSGQDVITDFDPQFVYVACETISDIRIWPASVFGKWKKIQVLIKLLIRSSFFDNFLTISVFINTVCLALDRHNIDPVEEKNLAFLNTIFTWIFIVELSLKIIGLGPLKYLKDKMNYLDGIVVTLSIVEMGIVSGSGTGALSAFRAVRIFRIFRVLRVARLLRSMQSMQIIIAVLLKSMNSFVYLALLLMLFLFIYSLLGMQVFGGQFNFNSNSSGPPGIPRTHFNNFSAAFLTAFQILTMESWPALFYDALRSPVNKVVSALYFISWVFLGNFMLLNLFLAILLDSFTEESPHGGDEEENDPKKILERHLEELSKKESEEMIQYYSEMKNEGDKKGGGKGLNKKKKKRKVKKDDNMLDESFEFDKDALMRKQPVTKKTKVDYEGVECELSFYIFPKRNPVRYYLYKAATHTGFETVILILIVLSSIKLVIDTYMFDLQEDNILKVTSDNIDKFFTVAFACESGIKAISFGLIQDKGSYLRETWSQLDFFIVLTSLIDAAFENINLPIIKILRLLRTLRPLRFISHNSGMKTIVMALLQSVGGIVNVAIVVMIVWMMFAILAVNLFGGKLQYCTVDTFTIRTKPECLRSRGVWKTQDYNFDSVPTAMITMFSLATLENWPDIMYNTINAQGENIGPKLGASPANGYFFVVYIFIGSFLFLNLFVGVIFKEFEDAQKEERNNTMLTAKEMQWVDMIKMIVNSNPDLETTNVPKQKWRAKIHAFITGSGKPVNWFDIFIMSCIVLNMFQMAVVFESASQTYNDVLDKINYFFTTVFAAECVLKLVSFGGSYFKTGWNIFDFFVVCSSLFDIAMNQLNASSLKFLRVGPQLARVLRVLRVSRLFRLVNKYKGLQALIQTIQFSLPSLFNVFSLLMLVYFIFAVLGTFLFRTITKGAIISDYNNFTNFGMAMLMVIRMSTGEDWNYIMFDCMRTEDDGCLANINCGLSYAPVYFIPYMMISTFIMLNLFILVILQQFEAYYLADDNVLNLFKEDLERFKKTWTSFTKDHNCLKLKDTRLVTFFASMEPKLGMKDEKVPQIIKHVMQMDLVADNEGFIYFNELLYKAMRRVYGEKHVRNKILVQHELNAMRKLEVIKQKMIKKSRVEERLQAGQVNPFMLQMYMNASFKGWQKFYLQNQEKREEELKIGVEKYYLDGESEHDLRTEEQKLNDAWEYKTEQDQTCSEDEYQENVSHGASIEAYEEDSDDQVDSSRMLREAEMKKDKLLRIGRTIHQDQDEQMPQPHQNANVAEQNNIKIRSTSEPPQGIRKLQTHLIHIDDVEQEEESKEIIQKDSRQKTLSPIRSSRKKDNVLISSRSGSAGEPEVDDVLNLKQQDDPNDVVLLKINMQHQQPPK